MKKTNPVIGSLLLASVASPAVILRGDNRMIGKDTDRYLDIRWIDAQDKTVAEELYDYVESV